MEKKNLLACILFLIFVILLLDRPINNSIPALGKFLNPFRGGIQNSLSLYSTQPKLPLKNALVTFDSLFIAHLFTDSEDCLYKLQGYITAQDRLWQMDFLSYYASGRLSEIYGDEYLIFDKWQRRIGLLSSAKKKLKYIEKDTHTKMVLDSYTAGVNEYINQLSKKNYPIEYKLLDYSPEVWSNLKTVLIMQYIGALLTGYDEDIFSTNLLTKIGFGDFVELFPDFKFESGNCIFPFKKSNEKNNIDFSFIDRSSEIPIMEKKIIPGSNGWAISPVKSRTNNAILCNDPHLPLVAPAIWYEIQLSSNQQNVYGYSIPGVPGVIVGFNPNISWGITNSSIDVKDWYKLIVKEDYSAYMYDNEWIPLEWTVEEIKVKNRESVFDTIYHTVHGPIVVDKHYVNEHVAMNYALKWTLHEDSNEFAAMLNINKSKHIDDFKKSISEFKSPSLNFIYADTHGNIGSFFCGNILKKQLFQHGKYVLDGTCSNYNLVEYLKFSELPASFNPLTNYVFSANNNPWNPEFQYYLNGYYDELRATHIDDCLSKKQVFNVSEMKKLQLDNTSSFAKIALPKLLNLLFDQQTDLALFLSNWDYKCDSSSIAATIFEQWWNEIEQYTWDELRTYKNNTMIPDRLITLNLLVNDPYNKYFNILSTDENETAIDIVNLTFSHVNEADLNSFKPWGDLHKININHLSFISSLGLQNISSSTHSSAINSLYEDFGASLRMVVEMSIPPKAWGIYAGSQFGGFPNLKDHNIQKWINGDYHRLRLFHNKKEAKEQSIFIWEY